MKIIAAGAGIIAGWFAFMGVALWLVSTLVTYLFGIDFGFWKAFATIWLVQIASHFVFSGIPRVKSK